MTIETTEGTMANIPYKGIKVIEAACRQEKKDYTITYDDGAILKCEFVKK